MLKKLFRRKKSVESVSNSLEAEKRIQELEERIDNLVQEETSNQVELLRMQLGQFDATVGIDGLPAFFIETIPESQRPEMLASASRIVNESAFKLLADFLVKKQVEYTVTQADNMRLKDFGAATINGISLFYEEVKRLDAMYKEVVRPEEEYDKHNPI